MYAGEVMASILSFMFCKIAFCLSCITSPAYILEHALNIPISFIIIPIFALANAAVAIDFSSIGTAFSSHIALGVIFGLIVGKILGIFGVAFIATKLKLAQLPQGASLSQVFGVSALAGIGFTMSIFVSDLAFLGNDTLIFQAKVGILSASFLAGLFGFLWLRFIAKKPQHL